MLSENLDFADLYPFKNNYFTHSDGIKQHYVDEGQGEPFVMIHGNPTWSFFYRDMLKTFMPTHRVIAPDHIGCGLSDKPSSHSFAYTLKEHIDRLQTLLDSLDFNQPINLAVHDWGGAIGTGYATRNPQKIKRLIIFNTAAFRLPKDCPFPWPLWLFRNSKLGAFLNNKFNAFSFIASHTCTVKKLPKEIRRAFRSPYNSPANRVAVTRFVQDIPLTQADPSFAELLKIENALSTLQNIPMLVCFGTKDFVFNWHFYNEWKKHFPAASFHSLHAGHYLLEDAGPEIFDLIKNFFSINP